MLRLASPLLAVALLCLPLEARTDIICETKREPVRLSKTIYVIEERAHCYHPEQTEMEKILTACNLLIAAYGQSEGQSRCRALLANSTVAAELDTAFGE